MLHETFAVNSGQQGATSDEFPAHFLSRLLSTVHFLFLEALFNFLGLVRRSENIDLLTCLICFRSFAFSEMGFSFFVEVTNPPRVPIGKLEVLGTKCVLKKPKKKKKKKKKQADPSSVLPTG